MNHVAQHKLLESNSKTTNENYSSNSIEVNTSNNSSPVNTLCNGGTARSANCPSDSLRHAVEENIDGLHGKLDDRKYYP